MSKQRVIALSDRPLRYVLAANFLAVAALAVAARYVAMEVPMDLKLQAAVYAGTLLVWCPVAIYGMFEIAIRHLLGEELIIVRDQTATKTEETPAQYSDANLRLVLGLNAVAVAGVMVALGAALPKEDPMSYLQPAIYGGSLLVWVPVMFIGMYEVGMRFLTGKVDPWVESIPTAAQTNTEVELEPLPDLSEFSETETAKKEELVEVR